jgi:hypothetical protein
LSSEEWFMNIGRWAVIAVAIAATTACSDSAEPDSSDESPSAEESAATESGEDGDGTADSEVPEDVQAAVTERMVAMDGLFGETPSEEPEVMSAEEFNAGAPETQVEAMEARGFEAAAYQSLEVPETADAVRAVLRFKTEKGAAEDVASGTDDLPGEAVTKSFDVPGVPGAVGFDIYGQTGLVGRNIAFNVGEYEYLLGYAAEAPPSKKQATRSEVADVAAQWYERVSELD